MKSILTVVAMVFGITAIHAQNTPDALMDQFVNEFRDSSTLAVRNAFNTNPWIQENSEEVDNLVTQIEEVLKYLGDYLDAERIEKIQLSDRLVVYTYLMNYERQPVRYIFELYKSKNNWMFYNIQYNLSFSEEMVSNYRLGTGK